jgi:hypothetical protein
MIISGEKDTVPLAIANSSYKHQQGNPAVTEDADTPSRSIAVGARSPTRQSASSDGSPSRHKRRRTGEETRYGFVEAHVLYRSWRTVVVGIPGCVRDVASAKAPCASWAPFES